MRCEDALVRMLDAEPGDLVPGAGDLGAHISSCQRCSAVAHTLSDETEQLARAFAGPNSLASAVKYRARRNRVVNYVISPATALAASVILWIMIKLTITPTVPAAAPLAVEGARVAPTATQRVTAAPTAQRIAPALVRVASSPPTMPVAVQALAATARDVVESVTPDFQIDPEPGTSATVWRVQNLNVTVVWLTK